MPKGVSASSTNRDFAGQAFASADFSDADLSRAQLRECDLTGADLRGASLAGADLIGACLADADLRGADLTGADLRNARLDGAALDCAILRRSRLIGASGLSGLDEDQTFGATPSDPETARGCLRPIYAGERGARTRDTLNGSLFASAEGNVVGLYQAEDWLQLSRLIVGRGKVTALAISPDETLLATTGSDKLLRLWHVGTACLLAEHACEALGSYSNDFCFFSGEGDRIIFGSRDGYIGFADQRLVLQGEVNTSGFKTLPKLSPTGRSIALVTKQGLELRSARSGKLCCRLDGVEDTLSLRHLEFSQNGRWLAAAPLAMRVYVWDLSDLAITGSYTAARSQSLSPAWSLKEAASDELVELRFSPDSNSLRILWESCETIRSASDGEPLRQISRNEKEGPINERILEMAPKATKAAVLKAAVEALETSTNRLYRSSVLSDHSLETLETSAKRLHQSSVLPSYPPFRVMFNDFGDKLMVLSSGQGSCLVASETLAVTKRNPLGLADHSRLVDMDMNGRWWVLKSKAVFRDAIDLLCS